MISASLLFTVLTLIIFCAFIVLGGKHLHKLRGHIRKERVNNFWTTHDIESGQCTIHANTEKGETVVVMNNSVAKFILADACPQFPLELVYLNDQLTALKVKGETYTLENSELTPISSKCFGYMTYLFLGICLLATCTFNGLNALVFLSVMPLVLFIVDRMTNNLVKEETLHQFQ